MSLLRVFASKLGVVVVVAIAPVLLGVGGCRVGYPFRGPGYDAARGEVHPGAGRQVLVVVTRGDIESGSGKEFANELRAVMDSMNEQSGLVGYSVRKELIGSRVWTKSVWVDPGSMERFVQSSAHRKAMASGAVRKESFIAAAALVDASLIPPDWAEAERMLEDRASQE